MIQDLSSEDKATLADRVKALTDENRKKFLDSKTIYDNVISIVESPEFSFEGNQEYKQKIINLKEAYKRFDSIAQYYENMYAYIRPTAISIQGIQNTTGRPLVSTSRFSSLKTSR